MTSDDIRRRYGLTRIINASGTMTDLGAAAVVPDAVAAGAAILPHFVLMSELHARASTAIAEATGAEGGFVTACSAAGITLAIAAAITGCDLALIERLPSTEGLRNEVVLQAGHNINYGAPVEQAVRLSGARPILAGTATRVEMYQLESAITERTVAVLHVV
jgi:L-seryl-tRNA(Ser) seleniumtransferase